MADQQREFKGIWIPREVWLDSKLNALDKVIFAEIDSFSSNGKVCFQNNATIAEFCQCSESKVSKTVSKLIDLGYIRCVSFDGRKRYLQSCLVNFTTLDSKKSEAAEQNLLFPPNTNKPTSKSTVTPYNPPKGERVATHRRAKATDYDADGFAAFWAAYPKKAGKADALKAWNKLAPDVVLQEQMGKALEVQKQSQQWRKDGGQYIPMPATWLNGRRWEDEVQTQTQPNIPTDADYVPLFDLGF